MQKGVNRIILGVGVLLLCAAVRIVLLPPFALLNGTWESPHRQLSPERVVRTDYYQGFFYPGTTFDKAHSQAILSVLQDSSHYGGDTTDNFDQLLIYYDAEDHIIGYTDLDLFSDELALAQTTPGSHRRGAVLTARGKQQLGRTLGLTNIQQQ